MATDVTFFPVGNGDMTLISLESGRTILIDCIGLGDGGAHLDMLCDSGYPTYLLGTWVRERGVLTLEQAVQRLTSDPADLFGIRGRGRLAEGAAAGGGAAILNCKAMPGNGPGAGLDGLRRGGRADPRRRRGCGCGAQARSAGSRGARPAIPRGR